MELLKRHIYWLLGAGLLVLITSGVILYMSLKNEPNTSVMPPKMPLAKDQIIPDSKGKQKDLSPAELIMIDVQGSVKNPGVYEMKSGDRVIHAIQRAGGFLDSAEVRSVNQAQKIDDEMIIYVAAKGEQINPLVQSVENENDNKLNINSADVSELQTLSGVGPSKAQSIILYREENGPFTSIEQLLEVRGIGEKTIEDWKDKIEFR
jgi:competence protein ComEA